MLPPARDSRLLKRRLDAYLWRDKSMPMARLRALLAEQFGGFERTAIIGGLVRDLARSGRSSFRSDVDLVIQAPKEEVARVASRLGAVPNRFGGYAYYHPHWKVDFWAMEATWAVVEGHVKVARLEDLLRCTFFDCDAILYDVGSRTVSAADFYFERLSENTIEINLRPTPSIDGNLLRAIRRVFAWGSDPGPRLRQFIVDSFDEGAFNRISKIETQLYGTAITRDFSTAPALLRALLDPAQRSRVQTSVAAQLPFPSLKDGVPQTSIS